MTNHLIWQYTCLDSVFSWFYTRSRPGRRCGAASHRFLALCTRPHSSGCRCPRFCMGSQRPPLHRCTYRSYSYCTCNDKIIVTKLPLDYDNKYIDRWYRCGSHWSYCYYLKWQNHNLAAELYGKFFVDRMQSYSATHSKNCIFITQKRLRTVWT